MSLLSGTNYGGKKASRLLAEKEQYSACDMNWNLSENKEQQFPPLEAYVM
jgi:hypothetical protein